ncbi:MAG: 2-C-methyl-D-erythritol 2,4-cyclodiphosphate synthase, partial [Endozoicomonadaceae bacterium]|nr:2-C-methyl-D-erythritol 2,4-cyclodiphosphate synthase [Endozoicomonadaceae bacterium]
LDKEAYRYQVFISDLTGQDIQAHNNDPAEAINKIRDWLNNASIADINIKATTTEKMGFVGAGEGIAVHAVVLLNEC